MGVNRGINFHLFWYPLVFTVRIELRIRSLFENYSLLIQMRFKPIIKDLLCGLHLVMNLLKE
jgi:hypothetical protein